MNARTGLSARSRLGPQAPRALPAFLLNLAALVVLTKEASGDPEQAVMTRAPHLPVTAQGDQDREVISGEERPWRAP